MQEEAIQSAARQFDLDLPVGRNDWMNILTSAINELLITDFNKLISILYRLDVSEPRLRQRLASAPARDAATTIADMIVERQVQKIKSRQETGRDDITNIPEEDRW